MNARVREVRLHVVVRMEDPRAFMERLGDDLDRSERLDAEEVVVRSPVQAAIGIPDELALELVLLGDARGKLGARDLDVQEEEAFGDAALLDGASLSDELKKSRRREPGDDPLVAMDLLHGRRPIDSTEQFRLRGRDENGLVTEEDVRREDRPRARIEDRIELRGGSRPAAQGLEEEAPGRPIHLRGDGRSRVQRRDGEDSGGPLERVEKQALRESPDRGLRDVPGYRTRFGERPGQILFASSNREAQLVGELL